MEKQERKSDSESLIMDRRRFWAFIAMVINCACEIETKSEKIKMVVHTDKEILGIFDVQGDEIQGILEKGFGGNQNLVVKLGFMKGSLFCFVWSFFFFSLSL